MLTAAQKYRLQLLHAYEWVNEDAAVTSQNLEALFRQIETAEELWYASFIVPWDPAEGSFQRILDHHLCDRGIALFLYWSLNPISFHRPGGQVSYQNGALIEQIEKRFANGDYLLESVAYSPRKSTHFRERHDGVPDSMLNATTGVAVELDYRQAVFATC